jgi:hypothetical protein
MTLQVLLEYLTGAADELDLFLDAAASARPELRPKVEEWRLRLRQSIDPINLAALAGALPAELAAIVRGNLNPREHPSDAI